METLKKRKIIELEDMIKFKLKNPKLINGGNSILDMEWKV